jgi:hypothetical protein
MGIFYLYGINNYYLVNILILLLPQLIKRAIAYLHLSAIALFFNWVNAIAYLHLSAIALKLNPLQVSNITS